MSDAAAAQRAYVFAKSRVASRLRDRVEVGVVRNAFIEVHHQPGEAGDLSRVLAALAG
jgi:hypothetical protein